MAVERSELLRVAALARLHLAEPEAAVLTAQLNGILAQVEQLLAIELGGAVSALAPDAAPAGRSDAPGADPLLRPLAELGPGWREGYCTVPRVLAP